MGILYSVYNYFGYGIPGRTDDPDPVTGLTSRDRYLITNSWAAVRKNPTESGVELFKLLFKNHPKLQDLFPFRGIPLSELPENKRFRAHANSVIYGFSAIVDALDDTELLISILVKSGETHVPRKALEPEFLVLKSTLIELFSQLFTQEEVRAWKKALDVAFDVMIKAIKDTIEHERNH